MANTGQTVAGEFHLYVDGSYDPTKGRGGWGVLVVRDSAEVTRHCGSLICADSSKPELVAVLEAARWLEQNAAGEVAIIWSDSIYAVNGCNRWRHIWRTNRWRKRAPNGSGRSRNVANMEIWKLIDLHLLKNEMISVQWCKGHVGLEWNESADDLARRALSLPSVSVSS